MTEVPEAALAWLFGEGPDTNGKWFGECEDTVKPLAGKYPRKYWWRSKFRAMIKDAAARPQYLANCQLKGVCRWECETPGCTNYGKVIVVRRCVEERKAGVIYPEGQS